MSVMSYNGATMVQSVTQNLGCASDYTAVLMPRGGMQAGPALGVFGGLTSVSWGRTMDAPSQAKIVVALPQAGAQCCKTASLVEKWATELHLYRHVGPLIDKVWEGPVIQYEESLETGHLTVMAYDVLEWMKVRVNHTDWVWPGGLDPCTMVAYMIADGFLPDDPYVTEHMVVSPAGGLITDNTPAETVNVWQHLTQILQSQVDVTTVGRRIIVTGEGGTPWTKVINLGPDDINGDVVIGDDGTDYCNRLIVQGSGVARTAKWTLNGQLVQDDPTLPILSGDQDDDYHGLVEHLVKMNQVLTRPEAWSSAANLLAFSQQSGYVRGADGATLLPTAPCKMSDLVCGTIVNFVPSPYFCSSLPKQTTTSLQNLTVNFAPDTGETVGISVGPVDIATANLVQSET